MKTWNDAAALWLAEMSHKRSIDHDRRKLDWLRPQLGHLRLVDVDRFVIAGIAERKLAESSPSTAN
ncbi:MAG: site-specific integrase, partial [Pigmentiphaga sp.]